MRDGFIFVAQGLKRGGQAELGTPEIRLLGHHLSAQRQRLGVLAVFKHPHKAIIELVKRDQILRICLAGINRHIDGHTAAGITQRSEPLDRFGTKYTPYVEIPEAAQSGRIMPLDGPIWHRAELGWSIQANREHSKPFQ